MTSKSKILLAVSLAAFAVSLTGVMWGFFLPVGAIVFGQFMIFMVLGKETALFDEEQRRQIALADQNALSSKPSSRSHREISLTAVHNH
jgi:hypothetical protein